MAECCKGTVWVPLEDDTVEETGDLRAAVRLVGPRLSDLRRYFGKSAPIIFLDNRLADRQARHTASTWSAFPTVWGTKEDGSQPT